jgi:hypothetical protein
MVQTLWILGILLFGGILGGVIQIARFGGGSKRNMVLTGCVAYATMVICLLIGGEKPVWLVMIILLVLIPAGYGSAWVVQKLIEYAKQTNSGK